MKLLNINKSMVLFLELASRLLTYTIQTYTFMNGLSRSIYYNYIQMYRYIYKIDRKWLLIFARNIYPREPVEEVSIFEI